MTRETESEEAVVKPKRPEDSPTIDECFRLLLENTSDGVFLLQDGALQQYNKRLTEILQLPSTADLNIDKLRDRLISNGDKLFTSQVKQYFSAEIPGNSKHLLIDKLNGKTVSISLMLIPVVKSDRVATLGLTKDLSEYETYSDSFSELETRYRLLFEKAGDATFMIDIETLTILEANHAAEQQLGYTHNELIGMSLLNITPEYRIRAVRSDIELLKRDGGTMVEGINVTKDGREVPIQIRNALARLLGREVLIATCRDISEQKIIEEEQMKSERLEAVRQMAGALAHEFSQPLQALMTISELIENPLIKPRKVKKLSAEIPSLVERLEGLLNRMKGIVRIETKAYTEDSDIVDIDRSSDP